MQIKLIAVVLACASSLVASPLSAAPANNTGFDQLFELARERNKADDGHIIYSGALTGTALTTNGTAGTRPQKRTSACAKSKMHCSKSHGARNANCDSLVSELGADSRTPVVSGTRQICYKGDSSENEKCCVSVGETIDNLLKGDVYDPANTLLQSCTESGISGKLTNVLMQYIARKVLAIESTDSSGGNGIRVFYLAESRAGPRNDAREYVRDVKLEDIDPAQTDFIGASKQDCQRWALEQQSQHKFLEQDFIIIVDARSSRDNTVLASSFETDIGPPPLEFGRYGNLPPVSDTWYDYRIACERALEVQTDLGYGAIDAVYPVYFGLKEELTDENGIFDVARAKRLIRGEDKSIPLY
ncbi:MAG: hypothetical protein Q9227_008703 [Pyrenula ochraceoflavens]